MREKHGETWNRHTRARGGHGTDRSKSACNKKAINILVNNMFMLSICRTIFNVHVHSQSADQIQYIKGCRSAVGCCTYSSLKSDQVMPDVFT